MSSSRHLDQPLELPALLSEVGGRKFDAGDLGGEADMQVICGWCGRHMRDGSLPASHAICPSCKARIDAELDEREAGELRQLRMVGDVIARVGGR